MRFLYTSFELIKRAIQMRSIQHVIFSVLVGASTLACAQPKQLDILGVKPGLSTKEDVQNVFGKTNFYEIGGIRLVCMSEYDQNVLGMMACMTGKEVFSKDVTSSNGTILSNVEVHKLLSKGFQKKFGEPTIVKDSEVQNGLGMNFQDQVVMWEDKKGNRLRLILRFEQLDQGLLVMESAQRLEQEAAQEKLEQKSRQF